MQIFISSTQRKHFPTQSRIIIRMSNPGDLKSNTNDSHSDPTSTTNPSIPRYFTIDELSKSHSPQPRSPASSPDPCNENNAAVISQPPINNNAAPIGLNIVVSVKPNSSEPVLQFKYNLAVVDSNKKQITQQMLVDPLVEPPSPQLEHFANDPDKIKRLYSQFNHMYSSLTTKTTHIDHQDTSMPNDAPTITVDDSDATNGAEDPAAIACGTKQRRPYRRKKIFKNMMGCSSKTEDIANPMHQEEEPMNVLDTSAPLICRNNRKRIAGLSAITNNDSSPSKRKTNSKPNGCGKPMPRLIPCQYRQRMDGLGPVTDDEFSPEKRPPGQVEYGIKNSDQSTQMTAQKTTQDSVPSTDNLAASQLPRLITKIPGATTQQIGVEEKFNNSRNDALKKGPKMVQSTQNVHLPLNLSGNINTDYDFNRKEINAIKAAQSKHYKKLKLLRQQSRPPTKSAFYNIAYMKQQLRRQQEADHQRQERQNKQQHHHHHQQPHQVHQQQQSMLNNKSFPPLKSIPDEFTFIGSLPPLPMPPNHHHATAHNMMQRNNHHLMMQHALEEQFHVMQGQSQHYKQHSTLINMRMSANPRHADYMQQPPESFPTHNTLDVPRYEHPAMPQFHGNSMGIFQHREFAPNPQHYIMRQ